MGNGMEPFGGGGNKQLIKGICLFDHFAHSFIQFIHFDGPKFDTIKNK